MSVGTWQSTPGFSPGMPCPESATTSWAETDLPVLNKEIAKDKQTMLKSAARPLVAVLCSLLLGLVATSCRADSPVPAAQSASEEHNKAIVRDYFEQVLDGEQYDRMPELFSPYVVMHRPEGDLTYMDTIYAAFKKGLAPHTIQTTIHQMVASGDTVSVRLSHKLTYAAGEAFMQSRIGRFDVRGRTIEWDAMAMFRFEGGKIAEEWVSNDELGQLLQIGDVQLVPDSQ